MLFLIAAPNSSDNVHLDVLAKLSGMLMHDDFRDALLGSKDAKDFISIVDKFDTDTNEENQVSNNSNDKDLVLAVTACPTGVAHTYMGKEALEEAGKKLGVKVKVQTNGSGGVKNELTAEEIARAKAIIVAADAFVDMTPFDGCPVIECGVSKAIKEPEKLIETALSGNAPIYKGGSKDMFDVGEGQGKAHQIYKHLMSGISHMIPFVVAGGILLAFAYLIDGLCGAPKDGVVIDGVAYAFGSVNIAARIFHDLGANFGLGLMLPILGGFIAYSIAGRPGLVSGFVGSFACTKGTFSLLYFLSLFFNGIDDEFTVMLGSSSSGFIGAIFAGFIAGYFTRFIMKKFANLPRELEGVRDMLIIPLITTAFVGFCMLLLNVPFGFINIGLSQFLFILKDANLIFILAALVAGLMATDMGGPINKAAHYFVLSLVSAAVEPGSSPEMQTLAYQLMAANIIGIMVPPVSISIATWMFPQKFTFGERAPALANMFTGLCGITESAIPYLTATPLAVWVSTITGSAVGGVVSMFLGMEAIAPEGGTISYMVMGATCWKGFVALAIGAFLSAFLLAILRKDVKPELAKLNK